MKESRIVGGSITGRGIKEPSVALVNVLFLDLSCGYMPHFLEIRQTIYSWCVLYLNKIKCKLSVALCLLLYIGAVLLDAALNMAALNMARW